MNAFLQLQKIGVECMFAVEWERRYDWCGVLQESMVIVWHESIHIGGLEVIPLT